MATESIFSASRPWFGAEGTDNGKPTLFRGRQIPDAFVGDPSLPILFVISAHFEITDPTGLPDPVQYRAIEEFEKHTIDSIESNRLGIATFVQTLNGIVRYSLYVSNVENVANSLSDIKVTLLNLEFASGDDPGWSEYKRFLSGMRCG